MTEEQLLERGRMADEAAHAELAERADRLVQMILVDVEPHGPVVDDEIVEPGHVLQRGRRAIDLRGDRRSRQVPEIVQRAALDHPAEPDDAHAIAEGLDLREDMAREQDRSTLEPDLVDAVLEHGLHQPFEANAATSATFCRLPFE